MSLDIAIRAMQLFTVRSKALPFFEIMEGKDWHYSQLGRYTQAPVCVCFGPSFNHPQPELHKKVNALGFSLIKLLSRVTHPTIKLVRLL